VKKENVVTDIQAATESGEVASVTDDQCHLAHFVKIVSME
jgi:hypothetical protein